jgi:hypothetical protein
MLPLSFKPKYKCELIRIGSKNDGGYLVEKQSFIKSKFLIGVGINDDWKFEKEFNRPFIGIDDQICYKFLLKKIFLNFFSFHNLSFLNRTMLSIKKIFDFHKLRKNFIKSILSNYHDPKKGVVSLEGILNKRLLNNNHNDIFLKIDIEGSEYRILSDILRLQNNFSGIVIEFHDIDIHQEIIEKFISEIDLDLVHIHSNNFGGIDKKGDPLVIELTFSKFSNNNSNNIELPNKLDAPNNIHKKEIILKFNI